MKYSEAILDGFKAVGGRQCRKHYYPPGERDPTKPTAVCILGALNLGSCGSAYRNYHNGPGNVFAEAFERAWGFPPQELNDDGMAWEDLYGMAVAAGL